MDSVDLVNPGSRREAKPVTVQEGDHVLPTGAVLGLPADVESTAKPEMAERPNAVPQDRIQLLLLVSGIRNGYRSHTRSGNASRSWRIHVFSKTDLVRESLVARLISAVASRSLMSVFSTSM